MRPPVFVARASSLAVLFSVGLGLLACRTHPKVDLQSPGAVAAPPVVVRPPAPPEDKLPLVLRSASPPARVRALVDMNTQVDLRALGEILASRGADKAERRRTVLDALRSVARDSQSRLDPLLEDLRRRGEVGSHRGFTAVNRLLVEGTPAAFRTLAQRPEVATIELETEHRRPVWAAAAEAPVEQTESWAIAAVRADVAWGLGLDGTGVVVGAIDSGASDAHEQLRENFVGRSRGWFDPTGAAAAPRDGAFGHGSGVLSCAVGRNVAGVVLGVAPGARWAACAALPEGAFNNILMTECADWILQVAQPDVLINAWLSPNEGCDESFRRIVDAWRAAEILPVFTAGNLGPAPGANRSPANYTDLYPGGAAALAAGGLAESGDLFDRSGTGPGRCDPRGVFPSVAAPADKILTAVPLRSTMYRQAEGVSFAAGFLAGAAALLIQSDPEASVVEVETALREGAVDIGAPGPDDRFGYGRLDVPGALDALARLRGKTAASRRAASDPVVGVEGKRSKLD